MRYAFIDCVQKMYFYSSSQLPPALGVFRRFLTQFLINLHKVLQALFPTITEPNQKIREI